MKMSFKTNAVPMTENGILEYPWYSHKSRKELNGGSDSRAFSVGEKRSVTGYTTSQSRAFHGYSCSGHG